MNWYDTFSYFYDMSTEHFYNSVRQTAFERLEKDNIAVLIDFACGTGQNFPHLIKRLGEETCIVGTDLSAGMLEKAKRRVTGRGWQNVSLLEADARTFAETNRRRFRVSSSDRLRGVHLGAMCHTELGACIRPPLQPAQTGGAVPHGGRLGGAQSPADLLDRNDRGG